MHSALPRPVLLRNADLSDLRREFVRRFEDWLAALPDGRRWTRMDYAFAGVVAVLALSSTGFFTTAYRIWSDDPNYFSRRLIASMETATIDEINTGAIARVEPVVAASDDAMPAPEIVRNRPLVPQDYEIVMIFGDEVLLATSEELFRAKVGSHLPGLGRLIEIDETAGSVRLERATLTTAR